MAKIYHLDTTRRALLSAGLAATALPLAANAAVGPDGMNRLGPTEIGWEMIRLLPAHAVAVWHTVSLGIDDPDSLEIECWERRTWTPIVELANKATNIVDLAIANRIWRCGEATLERDDPLDGSVGDPLEALADRLTAAVLAAAGIPERACWQGALWEANGWYDREPTPAERREALAREAIPDAEIEAYWSERADLSRLIQES